MNLSKNFVITGFHQNLSKNFKKETRENLDKFEIGIAVGGIYDFLWDILCCNYGIMIISCYGCVEVITYFNKSVIIAVGECIVAVIISNFLDVVVCVWCERYLF